MTRDLLHDFDRMIATAKLTARNGSERLAADNLPLIPFIAAKFCKRNSMPLDWDHLSIGLTALYRAAEKFDPDRGFKFTTYACTVIWKTLQTQFRPAGPQTLRFVPFSAMESDSLRDVLQFAEPDRRPESELIAAARAVRRAVRRALDAMLPRDAQLVREYYMGPESETYKSVGERHGIGKERVRQLTDRGLKAARKKLRRRAEAVA